MRNEWYDLEYQGAKAKAPPCSDSTLQTPLPQQSSSSAREEEDHWDVMEERRRRRIVFENLARGMLRYLDNSNDVTVGITELQERVEAIRYLHLASGPAGDEPKRANIFRKNLARRRKICIVSWARWEAKRKGLVDLDRRCQDTSREVKIRLHDRASERMQDQIVEDIKELVHTKTEEALQLAEKEHDFWLYQNEKEEAERLQGARKLREDGKMAWAPPRNKSE